MGIIETSLEGDTIRRTVDLGEGDSLSITLTSEGIILDAYEDQGMEETEHVGTRAMTYDEWWLSIKKEV